MSCWPELRWFFNSNLKGKKIVYKKKGKKKVDLFCAFVLRQAITSSRYVILQLELQKDPKFYYNFNIRL